MAPIYDYHCPLCGEKQNIWARINEDKLFCPDCKSIMRRLISPSNIICDIEPYLDTHLANQDNLNPVLVKSRQHKKELLRERGLVQK